MDNNNLRLDIYHDLINAGYSEAEAWEQIREMEFAEDNED